MAVDITSGAGTAIGPNRTTNLPASIGPLTICGFVFLLDATNSRSPCQFALDGSNFANFQIDPTTNNFYAFWRIGGVTNYQTATVAALATSTWYFIAMTRNGATLTAYARAVGASGALLSQTNGAIGTGDFTPSALRFAQQGVAINVRNAGYRIWLAELSAAELELEARQQMPRRYANLHEVYPFIGGTDAEVLRGRYNGFDLTDNGAGIAEGPPVPWIHGRRRQMLPYTVAAPGGISIPVVQHHRLRGHAA